MEFGLDVVDEGLELLDRYVALGARDDEASEELAAIERLGGAIALDHHERHLFATLVGGEAIPALQALPAAADGVLRLGGARVDDLRLIVPAERTPHTSPSPTSGLRVNRSTQDVGATTVPGRSLAGELN